MWIIIYISSIFASTTNFTKISRIDEDALDYMVPKLIIQPIVENAIYHGLEMKIGQGQIIISAYITETRLIIDIQDDGLGISEEAAEAERYPFGRKHTDQAAYERLVHRPAERERAHPPDLRQGLRNQRIQHRRRRYGRPAEASLTK